MNDSNLPSNLRHLTGVMAAHAIRMGIGKRISSMPPVVEVIAGGEAERRVHEAVSEAGKRGGATRKKNKANEQRIAALEEMIQRLISERTLPPHVAPPPPPVAATYVDGEEFVGCYFMRRVRHAEPAGRREAIIYVDRVEEGQLRGEQIGSSRRTFRSNVKVFREGLDHLYVEIRGKDDARFTFSPDKGSVAK